MQNKLIDSVAKNQIRNDIPEFKAGDTLKVFVKITEEKKDKSGKVSGTKTRTQLFEGLVIKRKGKGIEETFTVRKISNGVGVERTFPIHSPVIDRIENIKVGKVRRAKLNYIRDRKGKAARIKEVIKK